MQLDVIELYSSPGGHLAPSTLQKPPESQSVAQAELIVQHRVLHGPELHSALSEHMEPAGLFVVTDVVVIVVVVVVVVVVVAVVDVAEVVVIVDEVPVVVVEVAVVVVGSQMPESVTRWEDMHLLQTPSPPHVLHKGYISVQHFSLQLPDVHSKEALQFSPSSLSLKHWRSIVSW